MNKPQRELDLQEIFLFLWQHAVIVVLCMALGAAAMAGLTLYKNQKAPACQATALMTFDLAAAADQAPDAGNQFGYYNNIANTANVIVQSDAVLSAVAEQLSLPLSAVQGHVSLGAVSNTTFLQLSVTGTDAQTVEQICAGILSAAPQVSAEMTDLGTLQAVSEVTVSPLAGGSPAKSGLIGALIGAILGIVVLVGIELFDRHLHDAADIACDLDLKTLGVIPAANSKSARLQPEAWRTVRTALQALVPADSHPLLLVAGAEGSAPRADAEQLARAFAQNGRTVLLVDADRSAAGDSLGLSDLLQQKVTVQDAPVASMAEGLSLLSFGHPVESLADLLEAPAAQPVWDALRARYDCVLVSVSDAEGTADAAALSRFASGAVLLVRAGKTPIESARLTREHLSAAPVLGAVLTGYAWEKAPRHDGYYHALAKAGR